MQTPRLDLCDQRAPGSRSDAHGSAPRPSTRVDRVRKVLDRAGLHAPSCHGTCEAAARRVRGLALRWHGCPSSPGTVRKYHGQACPAARRNGKRYGENFLENLRISDSMHGVEMDPQNPF